MCAEQKRQTQHNYKIQERFQPDEKASKATNKLKTRHAQKLVMFSTTIRGFVSLTTRAHMRGVFYGNNIPVLCDFGQPTGNEGKINKYTLSKRKTQVWA